MDAERARELKRYTRELLRDHEKLTGDVARLEQAALEAKSRPPADDGRDEGNTAIFEELCRVRGRAEASEMAATRLRVKLAVLNDLRGVDVARARAAASRALAEALASLRRRSRLAFGDVAEVQIALAVARAATDADAVAAVEREALCLAVERTCAAAQAEGRRLRNVDGATHRLVSALEAALLHRNARRGGHPDAVGTFLLEAAAATAVVQQRCAATADEAASRRDHGRALLAVAKAQEAHVPTWAARMRWGRGRVALLELLNRCALGASLAALSFEPARSGWSDDDGWHLKSASAAVDHFADGAVMLDVERARRIAHAVLEAEVMEIDGEEARFALKHLCDRAATLEAHAPAALSARRASAPSAPSRAAPTTPPRSSWGRAESFDEADAEAFSPASLLASTPSARRARAKPNDGGSAASSASSPSSHGRSLAARAQREEEDAASSDEDEKTSSAPDDDCDRLGFPCAILQGCDEDTPPPRLLAALRRCGAASAVSVALGAARWRDMEVRPQGLGHWLAGRPTAFVDERIPLRDGADDHVVVWQWQSRSKRLRWSLEATAPGGAPVCTALVVADAAARPAPLFDRIAYGAVLPGAVWPADHVAGASGESGPVRECWAVVRQGTTVHLRCELVEQKRPLVRVRHARVRIAAVRAEAFAQALVDVSLAAETGPTAATRFARPAGAPRRRLGLSRRRRRGTMTRRWRAPSCSRTRRKKSSRSSARSRRAPPRRISSRFK
ncbi:hypothetical protein M885DRAFT_512822 [Pelagophyceae sp. CCMP2097]|nr:hypothetical protein M885DRAFT_512822 [Pelagophyceae sp. CCMP2097]